MNDHSLPYAVNGSMLFTELSLLERPQAVADAGFRAVEFWWPFSLSVPTDGEVDAFVRAVADAGVQLIGLNFAAGDMPAGDRGLVSWPGREGEFRDNIDVVVDIGRRLGCKHFNALYGNRIDGRSPQEQDELAVENLMLAAEAVGRIGGTVLVEAVSGPQPYPLRTAADAVAMVGNVRARGVRNVDFLADLYHLAVNGDDMEAIATYADRIGHLQVADHPGRHEPGTGHLDLGRYVRDIERAGYSGWLALEYLPSGSSLASFDWIEGARRGAGVPARSSKPERVIP